MKAKHFLCEVLETIDEENYNLDGEEFIVMAYTIQEVKKFLDREFNGYRIKVYKMPLTDEEAEMSGLDEYTA